MKYLFLFTFLIFQISSSLGQKSDTLENFLYKCLVQSFQDRDIDLNENLERFEEQMVMKGALDSTDGASFYKLYQRFAENGDLSFDVDPEFTENITKVHPMNYYSTDCILKVINLDSNILMNSKTFRLAYEFDKFKSKKCITVSMVAKKITDVLDASDFEHPYHRATALLSIANICNTDQGIKRLTQRNDSSEEDWDDMIKLSIQINEKDQIFIADSIIKNDDLKSITKDFILQNDSNLVISIQTTIGTGYDFYISTQKIIHQAYDEIRSQRSLDIYNKPFEELSEEERSNIKNLYPSRLIEF